MLEILINTASAGVNTMYIENNWHNSARSVYQIVFILLLILLLSGCELIKHSNLMDGFKRETTLVETDNISERGFGKLSKGQFIAAQALFDEALKTNPRDVYALFGKGIVYSLSGPDNMYAITLSSPS